MPDARITLAGRPTDNEVKVSDQTYGAHMRNKRVEFTLFPGEIEDVADVAPCFSKCRVFGAIQEIRAHRLVDELVDKYRLKPSKFQAERESSAPGE
jgi:hypothetical protein